MKPTIFALASAQGRAGVAVVRISGPQTQALLIGLAGPLPLARRAVLRVIDSEDGPIDQGLVLWFPAPHSFTGEDCAELHLHGSVAVLDKIYNELRRLGATLAEPGEFSRRAFAHGHLDLAQAEGLADLIDAEDEAQRRQALGQLRGEMGRRYRDWQDRLLSLLARIEAVLDFPDEDLPPTVMKAVSDELSKLGHDLSLALKESKAGERIREGYRIAIMGPPNAGKSTLFNSLCGDERAIVTPQAGTTRDILEAQIIIGGHRVWVYDTAGLRDTDDVIEAEGVRRARLMATSADLNIWVYEAAADGTERLIDSNPPGADDLVVANKIDQAVHTHSLAAHCFPLSLATGVGLEALRAAIEVRVRAALSMQGFPAATQARHRTLLEQAVRHIVSADAQLARNLELSAEDIRNGLHCFDALFGRVDVEHILDRIFSAFCIGK